MRAIQAEPGMHLGCAGSHGIDPLLAQPRQLRGLLAEGGRALQTWPWAVHARIGHAVQVAAGPHNGNCSTTSAAALLTSILPAHPAETCQPAASLCPCSGGQGSGVVVADTGFQIACKSSHDIVIVTLCCAMWYRNGSQGSTVPRHRHAAHPAESGVQQPSRHAGAVRG